MKPIKFVITRKGISSKAKFARWYSYMLYTSRDYTKDLAIKWNNLDDYLRPKNDETYGIGILERDDKWDPDTWGPSKARPMFFSSLSIIPTDATYLIVWGDTVTCNGLTKEIRGSADIIAVLENLRLEYDLQEEDR